MDITGHLSEAIKRHKEQADFNSDSTAKGSFGGVEDLTAFADEKADEKKGFVGNFEDGGDSLEKLLKKNELTYGDEDLVKEAARIISRLKRKADCAKNDLDQNYSESLLTAAELLEKELRGE